MSKHITIATLLFEGGLFLVALAAAWMLDIPLFDTVQFQWRAVWLAVAAVGPPFLLMVCAFRFRWTLLVGLFRDLEEQVLPLFVGTSLLDIAVISTSAGIAEEVFFRGLLQVALGERLNPVLGLVVTSVVFGLAHFITPTYAVVTSIIGFYLGCLFMVSENLLTPIVVHAAYDFLALAYLLRRQRSSLTELGSPADRDA